MIKGKEFSLMLWPSLKAHPLETLKPKLLGEKGKYDLIRSLKSLYKWVKGMRRERGGIYRQSREHWSRKKKGGLGKGIERGKDRCISPENMSYLRDEGGGKQGQAGQSEERRAFFSRQQNFLNNSWPLLRHFSSCVRFRRSWWVAWSTFFRCRLCWEEGAQTGSWLQSPSNKASLQQVTIHYCYVNIRSLVHQYKHLVVLIL